MGGQFLCQRTPHVHLAQQRASQATYLPITIPCISHRTHILNGAKMMASISSAMSSNTEPISPCSMHTMPSQRTPRHGDLMHHTPTKTQTLYHCMPESLLFHKQELTKSPHEWIPHDFHMLPFWKNWEYAFVTFLNLSEIADALLQLT